MIMRPWHILAANYCIYILHTIFSIGYLHRRGWWHCRWRVNVVTDRRLAVTTWRKGKQTGESRTNARRITSTHTSWHFCIRSGIQYPMWYTLDTSPPEPVIGRMNGCAKKAAAMHGLECNTRQYIVQEYLGVWYNYNVSFFFCCMFSSSGWWIIGWREWPGLGGCVDPGLQPFLTAIAIFVRFLIILIYIFPYILRIYPYITTPRGLPSSPHRAFSSSTTISTSDLPRIPALSLSLYFFYFPFSILSFLGNPPSSPPLLLLFSCKHREFFCSGSLFMHASRALSLSSSSWYAQHTHLASTGLVKKMHC